MWFDTNDETTWWVDEKMTIRPVAPKDVRWLADKMGGAQPLKVDGLLRDAGGRFYANTAEGPLTTNTSKTTIRSSQESIYGVRAWGRKLSADEIEEREKEMMNLLNPSGSPAAS